MASVSKALGKLKYHTGILLLLFICAAFDGCYTFRDASVPASIKTYRLALIENRAPYVNPQLAPQLTDRLRQKINSQFSRLKPVQGEDAHYDIKAEIRDFRLVTSGVSGTQGSLSRLAVTVHINFKNSMTEGTKSFEADVSRNFDFNANVSFDAAQAQLQSQIIQNMSDEIFNRIFSNW